jgi:serine/threonine-protein kinase
LFPAGRASASKVKALILDLARARSSEFVDEFLDSVGLHAADIDDETRLIPLATVHKALKRFVELEGQAALPRAAAQLLHKDNLGIWTRILRGTQSPEELFRRLESTESEYGRSTRWETVSQGPFVWHGRLRIAHDPALEEDGLLAAFRAEELRVVPMLFGLPLGDAERVTTERPDVHEYRVHWAQRSRTFGVPMAMGALLSLGALAMGHAGYAAPIAVVAAGASVALFRRPKGNGARAQELRMAALERGMVLRDDQPAGAAGDLTGTVVAAQYRLGKRMGSGASGVIYEAKRISDGTPVAIKLLRAATAHDSVASDRLRREAEALGLAWHPNVVEVIDHGIIADGTSYLVMELLQGDPLSQRIKAKGRLEEETVGQLAEQILDAMIAIHAAGVVHRDLKPSNIVLVLDSAVPGGERLKVLDFGIARVEWEEMRITGTGAPMGTPGYMPPEQEAGLEVDARSDLFAVGALLYECFMGEPPPPDPALLFRPPVEGEAVKGESGVRATASVPPGWQTILRRALQPNREDRFADARAFLLAVKGLREAESQLSSS